MLLPTHFPVTCHTKHVGPGSTFVAINGFITNGITFIPQALAQGANNIIVDELYATNDLIDLCNQHNATLIPVAHPRQTLATLAAIAVDNPADKLTIIGITGTKGKTTTAFITEHLLRKAGYKTALISSIYNKILDTTEQSSHTTPEADFLHMFFARCVQEGVTHVVMEVSSHALSLSRVHGITFTAVGFSNLAADHLDFYHTMDNYFAAKTQLFLQTSKQSTIVVNADNEWSAQALAAAQQSAHITGATVYSYGQEEASDNSHYSMNIHHASCDGIEIVLEHRPPVFITCKQLFGVFNCYNIGMASLIGLHLGLSYSDITRGIDSFPGVPGRLQRHVLKNGALCFVDYAHNPSSVEAVLKTLRPFTSDLIVVIGCGGDRDKTKRPVMGALASVLGNKAIITDDNPRTEDSQDIIAQILAGIPSDTSTTIHVIPNRREAIAFAARLAQPDSIIALLGKGHENYHLVGNEKFHFDDFEEISKH